MTGDSQGVNIDLSNNLTKKDMADKKIGLDNPAFSGRFKQYGRGSYMPTSPTSVARQLINDIQTADTPAASTESPGQITEPVLKTNPVASPSVKPPVRRVSHSEVIQRSITSRPVASRYRKPFLTASRVVLGMAIIVFLIGLGVAFVGFNTNRNVVAQVQAAAKQQDSSIPKEEKPSESDIASYQVAPDMPRVITIKKIGVKARILNMGVDSKGALSAPGNVYDAGWYNQSSKPGQAGAMLIDGHVHGPTTKGVFYELTSLAVDDQIEVERGDGQKFTYKIVSSAVTPVEKTDMAKAMLPIEPGKQGLNLITCTGEFNSVNNDYPERLVIYASRL